MIYLILLSCLLVQDEIGYKPKDEFEIKLDLSFKQKSNSDDDGNIYREKKTATGLLPYLKLDVRILKLQPGEVKLKVIRDSKDAVLNKKLSGTLEIKLEVGYTDDIKAGISGYKHELLFMSAEKNVLSRILIEIDKEGNYMVNGEKRGKF